MSVSIKMLGDKELSRKLILVEDKMQSTITSESIRDAMAGPFMDAVRAAPSLTGKMRMELTLKRVRGRGRTGRFIGWAIGTGISEKRRMDGEAFYASFVELGTDQQEAQPFMRPALNNNKEAMMRDIGDGIKKRLEAIAR